MTEIPPAPIQRNPNSLRDFTDEEKRDTVAYITEYLDGIITRSEESAFFVQLKHFVDAINQLPDFMVCDIGLITREPYLIKPCSEQREGSPLYPKFMIACRYKVFTWLLDKRMYEEPNLRVCVTMGCSSHTKRADKQKCVFDSIIIQTIGFKEPEFKTPKNWWFNLMTDVVASMRDLNNSVNSAVV